MASDDPSVSHQMSTEDVRINQVLSTQSAITQDQLI
jgi:hypothetical protein